jgi:glycosyltransferase involved in cell wall biosynthesis
LHDSGAASLLEAIGYYIPFLVTTSGAHRVFLDHGIGFGFELENYNEDKVKIIKLLEKILNEPKVLEEERKKVEKIYKEFFSEKAKYQRLEKLFYDN